MAAGTPDGGGRPSCWPVLVVLLQVAAAGHSVLRDRGGVRALAAERASVTAVVVVTGDPVVLAGRGEQVRVLRDATAVVVDARGVRRSTAGTGAAHGRRVPRRAGVAIDRRGPRPARLPQRRRTTASRCSRSAGRRSSSKARVRVASSAERLRAGLRSSVDARPGRRPGPAARDWSSATPAAPRDDLTAAMRATGMTHLTAVSGSNVAVVTGLVLGLCVRPRRPTPAEAAAGAARPRGVRRAGAARAERRARGSHGRHRAHRAQQVPAVGRSSGARRRHRRRARPRPVAGAVVRLRAVVAGDPRPPPLHPAVG